MESRPGDPSLTPDDALADIAAARAAAADRLVTPWWYHPILGLIVGHVVVAYGVGGSWWRLISLVVVLIGVAALMTAYRRVTGVWISGFRSGPATRWAYAMGGAIVAGLIASRLVGGLTDAHAVWIWLMGLAVAIFVVIIGHVYDRALRAHLRGRS